MIDETIYKSPTEVKQRTPNVKIPFDKLEPGLSVFLHFNECREDSLRSLVSTQNSKSTKKFKFLKHKDKEYYEVACVIPVEAEVFVDDKRIVESSAEAKASTSLTRGRVKYPFDSIPEGMSFILPIEGTNETSLRVQCCSQSKKSESRFILLKHEKYGMFEVARVANKVTPAQFFQPSAEMQEKVSEYESE